MGCHISDERKAKSGSNVNNVNNLSENALRATFQYLDVKHVIYLMLLCKRIGDIIKKNASWCKHLRVDRTWVQCPERQRTLWFKAFRDIKSFAFANFDDPYDHGHDFIVGEIDVNDLRQIQLARLTDSSFFPKHFTDLFLATRENIETITMKLVNYSLHASYHIAATDDCMYNPMVETRFQENSPALSHYTPYLFPIICKSLAHFTVEFNPYNSFSDLFCLLYSFCLPNLDTLEIIFSSPPILDELEYQSEVYGYKEINMFTDSPEPSDASREETNFTPLVSAYDFFGYILNPMDIQKINLKCACIYFACPSLIHVGLISQFLRPINACMHRLVDIRKAQIKQLKKSLKQQDELRKSASVTPKNETDSIFHENTVISSVSRSDVRSSVLVSDNKENLLFSGTSFININSPQYTDTLLALREIKFDLLLLGNLFFQALKHFSSLFRHCRHLWPNLEFRVRNFLCAPSWISGNEPVAMASQLLHIIRTIGPLVKNEIYLRLTWLYPKVMSEHESRQLKSLKLKRMMGVTRVRQSISKTSSVDEETSSKRGYFTGVSVEGKTNTDDLEAAIEVAHADVEQQAQMMLAEWIQKYWNPEKIMEALSADICLGDVKVLYISYLDMDIEAHVQFLTKITLNNPYALCLRLRLKSDDQLQHLDALANILRINQSLRNCRELWIQTNIFSAYPQERAYYVNVFEFCCPRANILLRKWDKFHEAQINPL